MIITYKSLLDNRVNTFKLSNSQCKDLGYSEGKNVFENSFSLIYKGEIIAITHYI